MIWPCVGRPGNWEDAAVLPPYHRLVLDEGHHLEDVAAEHLGRRASSRGVERLFGRIERQGRGVLPALKTAIGAETLGRSRPAATDPADDAGVAGAR